MEISHKNLCVDIGSQRLKEGIKNGEEKMFAMFNDNQKKRLNLLEQI